MLLVVSTMPVLLSMIRISVLRLITTSASSPFLSFFFTVRSQDAVLAKSAQPQHTVNVLGQKWS